MGRPPKVRAKPATTERSEVIMYRWMLACLLAVAAAHIATPARAAMTEAQVKASVAAAFGVLWL